jgi:hypothetical protein
LTAVFSACIAGAVVMMIARHGLPAALFAVAAVVIVWVCEKKYPAGDRNPIAEEIQRRIERTEGKDEKE